MPGEPAFAVPASALRLSQLFVTRLCHDLSSPLSGLGAAIGELPHDPEALSLAVDAAQALARRIALLRAAWGDELPALSADDLRTLALGLPNAARIQVRLAGLTADQPFSPSAGRLLVNVMLLAAESLPGGGTLELSGNTTGQVVVCIVGKRAAWPAGLGALLASSEAAARAADALQGSTGVRGLQAPLTALLAHEAGIRASVLLAGTAERVPPLLLDLVPDSAGP
jgi:hypothetical protein